jgi:parvulin-like peptidyl-prolyl isomerase
MQQVERKLAVQEARRVMTDEEAAVIEANVERMVADSIRRAGTSTKLEGLLAEKGTTLEEQKRAARDNRLIRALVVREVDAHINVTPAEMQQYYEKHAADYAQKKEVRVRQIFLRHSDFASKDEATMRANELMRQIRNGADFATLARQNSHGPYAAKGGLWEWATEGAGTFPEPVEKAVFSMRAKEMRGPIVTDIGVHIVMVEDVRHARTIPFVELQDQIASALYEQKRSERYREFIRKIWDRSHVDIRWR